MANLDYAMQIEEAIRLYEDDAPYKWRSIDGELVLIDYGWGLYRSMRGALNERDIEEILERQEVVY